LARDGEGLLRLCENLAPSLQVQGLKLSYFHGSRQVWYPPALLRMDEAAAEFFASHVAFAARSWQECVELLGLSADTLREMGLVPRWTAWSPQLETKKALFLQLVRDAKSGSAIKVWLERQTALTCRYLREAGLVGSQPVGLVDCGWSGTWTDVLCDLVEAEGGTRPEVYFLGRRKASRPARALTLSFLFDHQAGFGVEKIPDWFHILVEFFLTASHGRTTAFKEESGTLVPVLAPADLQGFTPTEWETFRRGLLVFAQLYADAETTPETPADVRKALIEPLTLLWERPSVGEAALFGRHTIGLSPSRPGDGPIARPYRLSDALALTLRLKLPGYPPYWWHEGALAQTKLPLRLWMAGLWQAREFARSLRHAKKSGFNTRRWLQLFATHARSLAWAIRVPAEDGDWNLKEGHTDTRVALNQPTLAPMPVTPRALT